MPLSPLLSLFLLASPVWAQPAPDDKLKKEPLEQAPTEQAKRPERPEVDLEALALKLNGLVPQSVIDRLRADSQTLSKANAGGAEDAFTRSAAFFDSYSEAVGMSSLPEAEKRALLAQSVAARESLRPIPQKGAGIDQAQLPVDAGEGGESVRESLRLMNAALAAQAEAAGQLLRQKELADSLRAQMAANSRFEHESAAADAARRWLQTQPRDPKTDTALTAYRAAYDDLKAGKIDQEKAREQLWAFQRDVSARMDAAPQAAEEKRLFTEPGALQDFYKDNPEYAKARAQEAQVAVALSRSVADLKEGTALTAGELGIDRMPPDNAAIPPGAKVTRTTQEGFPGLLIEGRGLKRFLSFDGRLVADHVKGATVRLAPDGREWEWQKVVENGQTAVFVSTKYAATTDFSRFGFDDAQVKKWFKVQGRTWIAQGQFQYLQIDPARRSMVVRETRAGDKGETNFYTLTRSGDKLREEYWARMGGQFQMVLYSEYAASLRSRTLHVLHWDKHNKPYYNWCVEEIRSDGTLGQAGPWVEPTGVQKDFGYWDGFKIAAADSFAYKYIAAPVGAVFGAVGEGIVGGAGAAGAMLVGGAEKLVGADTAGSLTQFNAFLQASKSSPIKQDSRDVLHTALVYISKEEDKRWYMQDQRAKYIESQVDAESRGFRGLPEALQQTKLFELRQELERTLPRDTRDLVNHKGFADFVVAEGGASASMQKQAFGEIGGTISDFTIELGKGAAGGMGVGKMAGLTSKMLSTPSKMLALESRLAVLNKPLDKLAFLDTGKIGVAKNWLTGSIGTQPKMTNLGRAFSGFQHSALTAGTFYDTVVTFGDVFGDPSPESFKALARSMATNFAFMAVAKGDRKLAERKIDLPRSSDSLAPLTPQKAAMFKEHFVANQAKLAGSGEAIRPNKPTKEGTAQAALADAEVAKAFAEYNKERIKQKGVGADSPELAQSGRDANRKILDSGAGHAEVPLTKAQIDAAIRKGTLAKGVEEITLQNGGTCTLEATKNQINAARPDLNLSTKDIIELAAKKFGPEFAHKAQTDGLTANQMMNLQKALALEHGVGLKVIPPEQLFQEIARTGQGATVGIQVGPNAFHEVHVLGVVDGHVVFLDSGVGGRTTMPLGTFAKALRDGGMMVDPKGKPNPAWAGQVAAFTKEMQTRFGPPPATPPGPLDKSVVKPVQKVPGGGDTMRAGLPEAEAGFDRWLRDEYGVGKKELARSQPHNVPVLLDEFIAARKLSPADAAALRRSLAGGSGPPQAAASSKPRAPETWKENFPDPAAFDTDGYTLASKGDTIRVKVSDGGRETGLVIREDFNDPQAPKTVYSGQEGFIVDLMLQKGVFAPRMYHEGRSLKDLGGLDGAMRKHVTGDTSAFVSVSRSKDGASNFGRFVLEIDPKKGSYYQTGDLSEKLHGAGVATKEAEYITQKVDLNAIRSITDTHTGKRYDLAKPADVEALRQAARSSR